MMTNYSPSDLAYMDRNTYRPPKPLPEVQSPAQPTRHPLAGNRPGVRATSRKALKGVDLGPKQAEVLRVIARAKRPINDQEIMKELGWTINRVTGRRKELEEMGRITEAFRAVYPVTGRPTIYWKAVTEDEA